MGEQVNYDALGVEFKVIKEDRFKETLKFLWKHFCPHEPITRSFGLPHNSSVMNHFFMDALKQEASIAAFDKEGRMLGVRVAVIEDKSDWLSWIMYKAFYAASYLPSFMDLAGY